MIGGRAKITGSGTRQAHRLSLITNHYFDYNKVLENRPTATQDTQHLFKYFFVPSLYDFLRVTN